MWYPPQQQQYSCHGYVHHVPSQQQQQQQQQTYSRASYCYNDDDSTATYKVPIDHENESLVYCQPTHGDNTHVTTPDCYVTTSTSLYGDEMSTYQSTRNVHWNPIITAPTKMPVITNNMPMVTPSVSITSSSSCWDWLLFPPQYYSESYTPLSTFSHIQHQFEEENDDEKLNLLASLPRCLLTLLYLTPKNLRTSDDENDSDREINSLPISDEPLLSSLSRNNIDKKMNNNISSNLSLSSNKISTIDGEKSKQNRSSTPDTDDGYQSASDASRSDYSQQSSIHYDHHNSRPHISSNERPLPTPLMPKRISYAAAVKPIITTSSSGNRICLLPTPIGKPKQMIINNSTGTNDMLNNNGQKLKFVAPRFERMHHAKQYTSSSSSSSSSSPPSSSNRTQTRSTNNNQRSSVRRR